MTTQPQVSNRDGGQLWRAVRRGVLHLAPPRRHSLLATCAFVLLGGLCAQSWFRSGTFIASGDVLPLGFLEPRGLLEQSRWIWGTSVTATGGYDYFPVTQTVPGVVGGLGDILGLGPDVAQRVFLTLVFASLAPAMLLLLRTLFPDPQDASGVYIGTLFYAFNVTLLFVIPNGVFLMSLMLLPLLPALALRAARSSGWRYPALFAAASMLLSYVFANPPMALLVATTTVATAVLAVAASTDRPMALQSLGRVLMFAVPVNLWWIVPAVMTLLSSHGNVTPDADPFQWAWTHARASFVNILKLTPVWSWPRAEYYPFAGELERPLAVSLRLLPVLAALAAAFVVRGARRVAAIGVVGVGLLLVLLAKGLHPPFPGLNAFLYRNVPGMWLFREPSGKFTLVLTAVLAVGLTLFVSGLGRGPIRSAVLIGIAAAIAATSYPLWMGSVIPDERPLLPSAHVRIPSYWGEAAGFINSDPGPTLLLPADDYYQMPYRWGFYGADVFADELIDPPVLRLLDTAENVYLEPDPSAALILAELQRTTLAGNWNDAAKLASALGIRWIIVRGDVDTDFPGRSIQDPDALSLTLSQSPDFQWVRTFGELDLFRLKSSRPLIWSTERAVAPVPNARAALLLTLPSDVTLVDSDETAGATSVDSLPMVSPRGWHESLDGLRSDVTVPPNAYRAFIRADRGLPMAVRLVRNGPDHRLEVRTRQLLLDGRSTSALMGTVELPPGVVDALLLGVDRAFIPLDTDPASGGEVEFTLRPGTYDLVAYALAPPLGLVDPSFEQGTWSPVGNCAAGDRRTPEDEGLRAVQATGGVDGRFSLELRSRGQAACVSQTVPLNSPEGVYRISVAFRSLRGAAPRLCIWEHGPERCAGAPALKTGTGWQRYDHIFRVDPRTTALEILLYADGGPASTKVRYDSVSLDRYVQVGVDQLTLPSGWIDIGTIRSEEPTAVILGAEPVDPPVLVDPSFEQGTWSSVEDCNALAERSRQALGIRAARVRGGTEGDYALELRARGHTACVAQTVTTSGLSGTFRLTFDHRSDRGAPPRVCVWEYGLNRCARLPVVDPGRGWQHYEGVFRPSLRTTALDVFLYADGQPGGTRVRYDGVRITQVQLGPSAALVPRSALMPEEPRILDVQVVSPVEYRVSVRGSSQPFLLSLAQTFDSGWELDGAEWRHARVNGYANGWFVYAPRDALLTLRYGPQAWVDRARLTSGLTALGLIALASFFVVAAIRRRRAARRPGAASRGGSPGPGSVRA